MESKPNLTATVADEASWMARAKNVFDTEIDSMKRTRDSVGESFVEAV